MKTLSKDARGFIEGVTSYIRSDARASQVLPRVNSLLAKVTLAAKKERVATVSSYVPLTVGEKTSVTRMLVKLLGHDVEPRFQENAELLGGMKIQVADWVVDTSLSSQLANLTRTLV